MSANPKDALGVRKPDLSLIPPTALVYLAKALEEGARKYGPFNWREHPVKYRVYIAAALRHIACALDREDLDPENPDKPHLAGAMASLAILSDAIETGNVIDDRPMPGVVSSLLTSRSIAPEATPTDPPYSLPGTFIGFSEGPKHAGDLMAAYTAAGDKWVRHHGALYLIDPIYWIYDELRPLQDAELFYGFTRTMRFEAPAISSEHDAIADAMDRLGPDRTYQRCICFADAKGVPCVIPGHPLPMRDRSHQ